MTLYIVKRHELHIALVEIEADSEQDAIASVSEGSGEEVSCAYYDTLEPYCWSASKKE